MFIFKINLMWIKSLNSQSNHYGGKGITEYGFSRSEQVSNSQVVFSATRITYGPRRTVKCAKLILSVQYYVPCGAVCMRTPNVVVPWSTDGHAGPTWSTVVIMAVFKNDRVIQEVRIRPYLWKLRDNFYKNKDAKLKAWLEIIYKYHSWSWSALNWTTNSYAKGVCANHARTVRVALNTASGSLHWE